MTQDEIKELAKQAGGTPYVNRHFPGKLAVAFSGQALIDFVALVRANPSVKESLTTQTTCTWTPMGDDMPYAYDTACGQVWCFDYGGPRENNFKFCHGCGKPLEVKE